MSTKADVAVVQHCAGTDVEQNLATLAHLSTQAADAGAALISWPEAFAYLGSHRGKIEILESLDTPGPILGACQALAQRLNCELLLGGFHEIHDDDPSRCYNTSVLLGSDGAIVARYRKIHLFDVAISDGPQLMESRHTAPGDEAVVAPSAVGQLGLTICYDLRFPKLYEQLVDAGAIALTVPSAFTAATGAAHWHALLRARAIENQCYVIAAAQHGRHSEHRASYGHSLIIDPWGEIVAEIPSEDGFAVAAIDAARVSKVRAELPSLANRRPFQRPE